MALQGKITSTPSLMAKSAQQRTIDAQKVLLSTGQSLAGLTDVDISARTDGSIMQYDATAGKFKVKPIIEDTNSLLKINGGSF
jgi:type II secretory pathway component GspD/PulD (secretin)